MRAWEARLSRLRKFLRLPNDNTGRCIECLPLTREGGKWGLRGHKTSLVIDIEVTGVRVAVSARPQGDGRGSARDHRNCESILGSGTHPAVMSSGIGETRRGHCGGYECALERCGGCHPRCGLNPRTPYKGNPNPPNLRRNPFHASIMAGKGRHLPKYCCRTS